MKERRKYDTGSALRESQIVIRNVFQYCKRVLGEAVPVFVGLIALALTSPQFASAQIHWERQDAAETPAHGAVVGGPGDAPEHGSPLFICRAEEAGGLHPGKWVKGNCNIAYEGREIVASHYEVAYGGADWRPYEGNSRGLVQTGNDADGSPFYSCRVKYRNLGYQPGKLTDGKCEFPYGGKEIVQRNSFEVLYAESGGPQETKKSAGKSFWDHLVANAEYQQAHRTGGGDLGASDSQRRESDSRSTQTAKPLCKINDSDVSLQSDGSWAGPNCTASDGNGHPAHPAKEGQQSTETQKEQRARFIETHSCMTTDGADKANALAEKCNKVTSSPHSACKIQQHTCDEIHEATKRACWGLAAEAPDFCLTYK